MRHTWPGVFGVVVAVAPLVAISSCGADGSVASAAGGEVPGATEAGADRAGDASSSSSSTSTSPDVGVQVDGGGGDASCPDPAGRLTLYLIPPSVALDWSTPNRLLATVAASSLSESALVSSGQVGVSHSIGHVHLALDCADLSIPLTGQTGGGSEWKSSGDGFGVVFRALTGELQGFPGTEHDNMMKDLPLRQANGRLSQMSFSVNRATCQRIKSFYDEYVARKSYTNYSGLARARRFEGAGCAIFGAGVVDLAGLLRRSLFTPVWSRSVLVGSARFANLGGSGVYAFGSNTVAPGPGGTRLIWPRGVDIPASASVPVIPGPGGVLDSWTGPEDQPFGVAGLSGELANKVPFDIYDPELMNDWVESVWARAHSSGSAAALGVSWTATEVDAAHEIHTDAHCQMPQTIPFEADNDDLFEDSDAP